MSRCPAEGSLRCRQHLWAKWERVNWAKQSQKSDSRESLLTPVALLLPPSHRKLLSVAAYFLISGAAQPQALGRGKGDRSLLLAWALCKTLGRSRMFYSARLSLSYFLFLLPAKKHLCSRCPQLSSMGKLSPRAFQTFLEFLASEFGGDEDEAVDTLVEFLTTSVERSHVESLRSFARREWLHNIQQAAETSGASVEPVYKAVFKALSQVRITGSPRATYAGTVPLAPAPGAFEWNAQGAGEAALRLVSSSSSDFADVHESPGLMKKKSHLCSTRPVVLALPTQNASQGYLCLAF